jgi:hypothetical protein
MLSKEREKRGSETSGSIHARPIRTATLQLRAKTSRSQIMRLYVFAGHRPITSVALTPMQSTGSAIRSSTLFWSASRRQPCEVD